MDHRVNSSDPRQRGNALLMSFLLVTTLAALATAHLAVVERNSRQAGFLHSWQLLHRHCESGIHLALHELTYSTGKGDGKIGTELWTTANDVGRDGSPATFDEGERDGIPTPGEPNLAAIQVGLDALGMQLLVLTTDTAWTDVKRIVATSYDATAIAGQEIYALRRLFNLPGVGTVFLQPEVNIDINGNAFSVSGTDMNPNGRPAAGDCNSLPLA